MYIEKFENAPCIWVYHDYFNCEDFVELIEEESSREWPYLSWDSSKTGSGTGSVSEYRTSMEMGLLPIMVDDIQVPELKKIGDVFLHSVFRPIDDCVVDYRESFGLQLRAHTGFQVLKYTGYSEYHIHHDHDPHNERVLSLVASLGEAESGGELEFSNFNLKIKLKKNSLVLFPSNFPYAHIAHPVTSGVKYSLVSWYI